MIEELRITLATYYLHLKWLHVLSVAIWSFSTAVAYAWYLKPVLVAAYRDPDDAGLRARRDDWMDRFDRGAQMEHYALFVMVVTAFLMLWIAQIDLMHWSFFTLHSDAPDRHRRHPAHRTDRHLARESGRHQGEGARQR